MMNYETVKRQRQNAIEYMFEKGVMNFPRKFNTTKKFKIKNFKNDTLVFYIINGTKKTKHVIFTNVEYDILKDTDENYAMKFYMMELCKDMYSFARIQGA